jgi:hypothetical protein
LAAYITTIRYALADPPACRIQGREPVAYTNAVTQAIQLSLKNALVINIGSADLARRAFGCLYGLEQDGDPYLRGKRLPLTTLTDALSVR